MDMRAQMKWISTSMTVRAWAQATEEYNTLLEQRYSAKNLQTPISKHPRALVEMLSWIEATVVKKITTNDYRCEYSCL